MSPSREEKSLEGGSFNVRGRDRDDRETKPVVLGTAGDPGGTLTRETVRVRSQPVCDSDRTVTHETVLDQSQPLGGSDRTETQTETSVIRHSGPRESLVVPAHIDKDLFTHSGGETLAVKLTRAPVLTLDQYGRVSGGVTMTCLAALCLVQRLVAPWVVSVVSRSVHTQEGKAAQFCAQALGDDPSATLPDAVGVG